MGQYTAPLRDMQFVLHELLGVDHFIMRCQWPGLPQEQTLATIRRLGEIFG